MRELLYVSTRKLANFDAGRRWWRATRVDTELRVPMLKMSLGAARDRAGDGIDMTKLRTVIRRFKKAPTWAAPGLFGGQWVRFSMPLGFEIFSATGRHGEPFDIALFGGQTKSSCGRRLLLCGSALHVLGSGITKYGFESPSQRSYDSLDGLRGLAREGLAGQFASRNASMAYEALLARRPEPTHELLSGHARIIVTAAEPEDIVLATPLYVQYGQLLSK